MIWISNHLNRSINEHSEIQSCGVGLIKKIWRFSRFYGEYQSLPPAERRRFVTDKSRQSNPRI